MANYVPYHVHTMLSNAVTNIDSVTTYKQYVKKAQECGMTALAFSEHGNIFEWVHKKDAIEAAGMKYTLPSVFQMRAMKRFVIITTVF